MITEEHIVLLEANIKHYEKRERCNGGHITCETREGIEEETALGSTDR